MNWYGFYNGKGFMLEEYMNGGCFPTQAEP